MRIGLSIACVTLLGMLPSVVALAEAAEKNIEATNYQRRTIYHSPQTPGYTCWAYVWPMPDESLMVTFTQATGPLEGRKRAPGEILRHMPNAQLKNPAYDFTGLKLENVFLHSTDGGKTWEKAGSEPFVSCMNGMLAGGVLALRDGTLVCNVWGQSLVYSPEISPTSFVRRSTGDVTTWSKPEYISADPKLQTCPKRIRRLRDGRLAMTGAASPFDPKTWVWEELSPSYRACLWVSKDPAGKAWNDPLYVAPKGVSTEEWDLAELDNGDLLGVFRTFDCKRCQSLLVKRGDTWEPGALQPAPFPHSGMPELLPTREGAILHIASSGVSWTADRGATWTKLAVPGSAYYPTAVQLKDGVIVVVSHIGSDDPYGKVDQKIVMDRFRLKTR
jgi:hypothetical protein